jgi:two-component system cell cycle response regulator
MTARVLVVDDVPANLKLLEARLCRRIDSKPLAIQQGARNLDVTISIGIAALADASDTAAAILKSADTKLYRAKRDGRNRVVADAA